MKPTNYEKITYLISEDNLLEAAECLDIRFLVMSSDGMTELDVENMTPESVNSLDILVEFTSPWDVMIESLSDLYNSEEC